MALQIEELRRLCTVDTIIMTAHVIRRCKERSIDADDIINVIMHGEIIKQYEDDKSFPSCLLLGMSIKNRYLHVVIASNNINLHIITAYYPELDEWEPDYKTRKGR
ncbi:MAG: DUF4258 domain-containing protein [Blautia sp.]|nr:DUF4258 domain-containing protein [Blautia sp.]